MSPAVLDGTIWIGVMAIAVILEIATVNMVSIWFAGGALASAIAGFCGAGIPVQIIIFMVVSVLLLLALRPLTKKRLKVTPTATNADEMIGQKYKALSDIGPGRDAGQIRVNDVEWRVISEDGSSIPAGSIVKVLRIEGTKLIVTREDV